MADVAYWQDTQNLSRWTRGQIRKFAAEVIGQVASNLTTVSSELLNLHINAVIEEVRTLMPDRFHGIGERRVTITWTDGNTREELPDNFAEFAPGGRGSVLDDGEVLSPLEVIKDEEWRDRIRNGVDPLEYRSQPLAIVFGLSTNGRRFVEIKPQPDAGDQFEIPYLAHLDSLDNDSDQLEAPRNAHRLIAWGVVVEILDMKGFSEPASRYAAKYQRGLRHLGGKVDEVKRSARVQSWLETDYRERTTYPR